MNIFIFNLEAWTRREHRDTKRAQRHEESIETRREHRDTKRACRRAPQGSHRGVEESPCATCRTGSPSLAARTDRRHPIRRAASPTPPSKTISKNPLHFMCGKISRFRNIFRHMKYCTPTHRRLRCTGPAEQSLRTADYTAQASFAEQPHGPPTPCGAPSRAVPPDRRLR